MSDFKYPSPEAFALRGAGANRSNGFAPVRRDYFPGGDAPSSDPEWEHEDAISGVCCLLSPVPVGGRIPAEGPYVAPGEAVEIRRVLDAVPWRWDFQKDFPQIQGGPQILSS